MLYNLLYSYHDEVSVFNVFHYITFRSALAVLTALVLTIILGRITIKIMKTFYNPDREDAPDSHKAKKNTPTMGGIFILLSIIITVLLWTNLENKYVWMMLFSITGFGIIGFIDDYLKLSRKNSKGLKGWYKFIGQFAIALTIAVIMYYNPEDPYRRLLSLPFLKDIMIDLSIFYIPFVILIIVGSSNAVNLTDGLDGLAIGLVAIAILADGIFVYISGNKVLAEYLQVLYLPDRGELAVFCGAVFGTALGFLWFNCHPAEIFMGDVGSLSLGGAIGALAVMIKHEIVLAIVGAIFVVETLSVMLQVGSFKLRGKRIFRMAPIHHHFELAGWKESKVIVRFWIMAVVLALFSLATLKLR
jgi:phospho-N-acetylmuramoyl-pentapeptide-transferase